MPIQTRTLYIYVQTYTQSPTYTPYSQDRPGYASLTNNFKTSVVHTAYPSQPLLILVALGSPLMEKPSAQTLLVTVPEEKVTSERSHTAD